MQQDKIDQVLEMIEGMAHYANHKNTFNLYRLHWDSINLVLTNYGTDSRIIKAIEPACIYGFSAGFMDAMKPEDSTDSTMCTAWSAINGDDDDNIFQYVDKGIKDQAIDLAYKYFEQSYIWGFKYGNNCIA